MPMHSVTGTLITLRPLKKEYIDDYIEEFSPQIRSLVHVDSQEAERAYLMAELEKQQQGKTMFYVIFDNETEQLIGAIEIRDPYESRGQLYCWINERYWKTGRFREAITLATKEYFTLTGRFFVNALVDVTNERSYHALKKVGFADVGIMQGPFGKQYELILRKK
jgi:RimJ/RimL family protein N-acetyltransferase